MEAAQKEYEVLRPQYSGFCGCDTCRGDVLVYALNRLPPHYTSTLKGEVVSKLEMEAGQGSIDVTVVLLDGMRRVALAPRCGAKSVSLP